MNKFLIRLLAISIFTGAAYFFIGNAIPEKFYFANYIYLLILFVVVTFLFHAGLQKSFEKGSKQFIRYYMGATGLKLFMFLIIILIYAFFNKEKAIPFALTFFFFYLIFTVFEVSIASKLFGKHAPEKKEDSDQATESSSQIS